jgi:glycosyltransferase
VLRNIYEKYGTFDNSYKFSADYELVLRFMRKHKIAAGYIEEVLFKKIAGVGNKGFFTDIIAKAREDRAALKANGYHFPYYTLFFKNLRKIPQFIA